VRQEGREGGREGRKGRTGKKRTRRCLSGAHAHLTALATKTTHALLAPLGTHTTLEVREGGREGGGKVSQEYLFVFSFLFPCLISYAILLCFPPSLPTSLPPSPITYVDIHQELDGGLLLHAELRQEAWKEGGRGGREGRRSISRLIV